MHRRLHSCQLLFALPASTALQINIWYVISGSGRVDKGMSESGREAVRQDCCCADVSRSITCMALAARIRAPGVADAVVIATHGRRRRCSVERDEWRRRLLYCGINCVSPLITRIRASLAGARYVNGQTITAP